jgi:hypothetical protein
VIISPISPRLYMLVAVALNYSSPVSYAVHETLLQPMSMAELDLYCG